MWWPPVCGEAASSRFGSEPSRSKGLRCLSHDLLRLFQRLRRGFDPVFIPQTSGERLDFMAQVTQQPIGLATDRYFPHERESLQRQVMATASRRAFGLDFYMRYCSKRSWAL